MSFYDQLAAATLNQRQYLLTAPIIADCLQGRVRIESYRAFLAQAYHHVRHTTPLLMLLGGRLPERLGWMRKAVAEYIEEEIGHEEWILNDIAAAGGDARRLERARREARDRARARGGAPPPQDRVRGDDARRARGGARARPGPGRRGPGPRARCWRRSSWGWSSSSRTVPTAYALSCRNAPACLCSWT